MSGSGTYRTWAGALQMSAFGGFKDKGQEVVAAVSDSESGFGQYRPVYLPFLAVGLPPFGASSADRHSEGARQPP
jgi:hypothetical protein